MPAADDSEITIEQVEALGAKRLAEIVVDHAYRDVGLLQAVRMALAATGPDDGLVDALAAEIDAVRADRQFYGYREVHTLAADLDRIREAIVRDLLPRQPRAAADLLGRFIRLDYHVFEHSDDSDGVISDAIKEGVVAYGKAWAAVPERDHHALAAEVLAVLSKDAYGVHGDVITAFKDALGPTGLAELERLIRDRLRTSRSSADDYHQGTLRRGLLDIADARRDVDAYIAVHQLAGSEQTAVAQVAERLVRAGRLEEALHRIEQPDPPPSAVDRLADMRIDILERLRRSDAAQAVRWERFARTLSETLLDEYLARVPERERATTLAQATQIAGRHRDVHSALSLLSIRAPQAAADLVLERHHRLSGDVYFVLRPAAERLADISPLASILLYRKMADAVLARSQWQHYGHAVGDIAAAEKLAPAVRDWHVHATQDAYRTRLSAEHRQKRAFWERMRKAGLAHPR